MPSAQPRWLPAFPKVLIRLVTPLYERKGFFLFDFEMLEDPEVKAFSLLQQSF